MGRTRAARLGAWAFAMALAAPGAVAASTVTAGWSLVISGNTNVPTFTLANTSDPGLSMTAFSITIGDTLRHFDINPGQSPLDTPPAGGTMALQGGAGENAPGRVDEAILLFTGFEAGLSAVWRLDVDLDSVGNSTQDYRRVMFNNGDAPNAVGTATFTSTLFDDPLTVALTLPDGSTTAASYTFTASQTFEGPVSAIPLPPALPLMAVALGALGLVGRRRAG